MTLPDPSPFGAATQKYWDKRHGYFSKWDQGIQTDAQGLYSVKPEKFALGSLAHVACEARVTDAHEQGKLLFRTAYFLA